MPLPVTLPTVPTLSTRATEVGWNFCESGLPPAISRRYGTLVSGAWAPVRLASRCQAACLVQSHDPIARARVRGRQNLVVGLLAVNACVLVVAMLLEHYNILPIVRHEIRTGQRQMLAPVRQVLPILLLAVFFMFMTAEGWQVAHDATPLDFTIVVVSLPVLSATVVAARAQDALAGAATFMSWKQVHAIPVRTGLSK